MKKTIKNNIYTIIGTALGIVAGYAYWKFIGCSSGTCPITSSPLLSSIWGAAIGGILFSMIKHKKDKN